MAASAYRLFIGDKNISSWSLRPWLLMREAGLGFDEVMIHLRQPATSDEILKVSPSGKVPALAAGDLIIWDSLAIAEFLAESHPELQLWPADRKARAMARSVAAEMHSGFANLRRLLPMDFVGRTPMNPVPEDAATDVRRILAIWRDCRTGFGAGGPFLFGRFSVADAMFAPVVSRFTTYLPDISLLGDDGTAEAYRAMMMTRPSMKAWEAGCRQ